MDTNTTIYEYEYQGKDSEIEAARKWVHDYLFTLHPGLMPEPGEVEEVGQCSQERITYTYIRPEDGTLVETATVYLRPRNSRQEIYKGSRVKYREWLDSTLRNLYPRGNFHTRTVITSFTDPNGDKVDNYRIEISEPGLDPFFIQRIRVTKVFSD